MARPKEKKERHIHSKDLKYIDDKKPDDDENVDAAKRNIDGTRKTSDVTDIENFYPYLVM